MLLEPGNHPPEPCWVIPLLPSTAGPRYPTSTAAMLSCLLNKSHPIVTHDEHC